jgi:hypothetical protein
MAVTFGYRFHRQSGVFLDQQLATQCTDPMGGWPAPDRLQIPIKHIPGR